MENKVKFEDIQVELVKFGNNNFLELGRKRSIVEGKDTMEFVCISRGYSLPDGSMRYKKSITIPLDKADEVAKLIVEFKELEMGLPAQPKTEQVSK